MYTIGQTWSGPVKVGSRLFSVCLFSVCKFSNFFLFYPPLFIQYSTEECSTVQLLVYILYLFVARGHCTSVYILIQLLLTLLILVLSYRHITTLDLNHFFPVIIIPHFGRIFSKILTSWSRSSWGCGGHWTQFPVPPGVSS